MATNERYLIYCEIHGKTEEEMIEFDKERWPGGLMTGFICWVHKCLCIWKVETGALGLFNAEDQANFNEWMRKEGHRANEY